MSRVIPWRLATEYKNGTYNGTVNWTKLNDILNFESKYFTHSFRRVNSEHRITILQSNKNLGTNVFATYDAKSMTIRISPTANFLNNTYLLAKVILHERLHWKTKAHITNDPTALMSPNAGTALNYTVRDGWYFEGGYTWKSSLRPWHEPRAMFDTFNGSFSKSFNSNFNDPFFTFNCGCCNPTLPNNLTKGLVAIYEPEETLLSPTIQDGVIYGD